jgi:hypothetical protein
MNIDKFLFKHRYTVLAIFVVLILILSVYLHFRSHPIDKIASIATGCFVVLTIFFSILTYEYNALKNRQDSKASRDILTYNTAVEWYKSPLVDYQKTTIRYEKQFIASKTQRTVSDFDTFINDPLNIEYKEALKGILNYFETISIGAYKGLIDKEFTKDFFLSIYKIFYTDYFFYIDDIRVTKNVDTIWGNFTNLVEEWYVDLRADMRDGTLKSSIIT